MLGSSVRMKKNESTPPGEPALLQKYLMWTKFAKFKPKLACLHSICGHLDTRHWQGLTMGSG